MELFESFLRAIAPYVIVVGSFGRNEETEDSDIDCYLRSKTPEEIDPETGDDTYMPEIIPIEDSFGLAWSSVIVGHIAVERQPGIPRMVEISYHYCIPYAEPVFERVIYGVRFLCAKDDKNCSLDERSDFLDWDDTVGDNVIRHPLPPY